MKRSLMTLASIILFAVSASMAMLNYRVDAVLFVMWSTGAFMGGVNVFLALRNDR